MKKVFLAMSITFAAVLMVTIFFSGQAICRQKPKFEPWPTTPAGWAKVEKRRQARLDMVQGVTEFNAGNYAKAAEYFESFLKVFPGDAQGQEYLDLARKWEKMAK
ncbi:MAG: hypothetical protein PVG60_04100 [Desulfarculaceae bacterium]|jgi:uncharacterized protein HemY